MRIDERIVDGITILDLQGKLTMGDARELLKDKVRSLLHQQQKNVVLNLGGLSAMDSSGLGELVSSYTTVTREGGQVKLLNLTKRMEDLLSITKLLTVFETFSSEREAVHSFTARV
jgi:anti-sigma B factor antagonist